MEKGIWFAAAALVLLSPGRSMAAWKDSLRPQRWEVRAGYGTQYIDKKSRPHHFQLLHLLPSVSVPIGKPVAQGWLHGQFEWAPELFLGLFTHPYVRPLIGVTPLQFRYVFQPDWRLHPYLFAGAGILYANVNRKETGKDLNFNPQFGSGFYYALNPSTSLIVEYRHVHISNAGLNERNSGMNNHTFLAGVSFKK